MKIDDFINIPLLKEFSVDEVNKFFKLAVKVECLADAAIFKEGERADSLYIIISGTVHLLKRIAVNNYETLKTLEYNDYFGETSIIESNPRSVTAIAGTDSTLLKIYKENIDELIKNNPEICAAIMISLLQIASKKQGEENIKFSNIIPLLSHELSTPLSVIKGAKMILERDDIGKEKKAEILNKIEMHRNKLYITVDNFISISKILCGEMKINKESCDLVEIIKKVQNEIAPVAKKKDISIKLTVLSPLPKLNGDVNGISKAIYNLLDNAIKFTSGKGEIDISVSVETKKNSDNKNIVTTISDTGKGISLFSLDQIFEPFSKEKETIVKTGGGAGIGLSIAKHIITLHGGEIWVESDEGIGSTFTFTLPLRLLK